MCTQTKSTLANLAFGRGFFNKLGSGRVQALSAGTQSADKVKPIVVEAMREVGIDIGGNKPKALTMDMVKKADRMTTMGCGAEAEAMCPTTFVETQNWELEDPSGRYGKKPVAVVRRF